MAKINNKIPIPNKIFQCMSNNSVKSLQVDNFTTDVTTCVCSSESYFCIDNNVTITCSGTGIICSTLDKN